MTGRPMPPGGRYRLPAILLHWLTAGLVLVQIPAGILMLRTARPLQDQLFILHKGLGVVLILVLALRLLWRLGHRPPPLTGLMAPWRIRLAHAVHVGLYLALLLMVASGYVYTIAGGFPIELLDRLGIPPLLPRHEGLSKAALVLHLAGLWLLLGLILLHLLGVLDHALRRRDGLIRRMLPRRGG